MRSRCGSIIWGALFLACLSKAEELKPPTGFWPTDQLEKADHIPDVVKKVKTYRVVPLHDVIWKTRAKYLELERQSGEFIGDLMRDFREECEKGEAGENPLYSHVWESLRETVEADKCETRIPIFFSGTATAFPAIGPNKIITVAHVFEAEIDSFSDALLEIEGIVAKSQKNEHDNFQKFLDSPEGKRDIEQFVVAELNRQKIPRSRMTPELYAQVIAKARENSRKTLDAKWDKELKYGRLLALNHFWNFPLHFWLFDSEGNVIFAPSADGKRKANHSYAMTGEVLQIHAEQPGFKPVPFSNDFDRTSRLFFKQVMFSKIIENMIGAIVITVHGVELDPPLELETEERSLVDAPVFVRGYPRLTWDRMQQGKPKANSDGEKEYISTGKVISPQRFYENTGIWDLVGKNPGNQEVLLKLTGDLILFTDAAVVPGNSGSPILNSRGKVVGITNMVSQKSKVEDNIAFGPTGYGTTAWLETYLDLQKVIKSPAVKDFFPKKAR